MANRKQADLALIVSGGVAALGCVIVGAVLTLLIVVNQRTAPQPTATPTAISAQATPSPAPTATPDQEPTRTLQPTPTQLIPVEEPTGTPQPSPTPTEGDDFPALETATPEPIQEATQPPSGTEGGQANGLTDVSLSLNPTTFAVNQRIPFTFTVTNATQETIVVGIMGVSIVGTEFFQTSWRDWQVEPGKTDTWTDGISGIGDAGTYQLQLAGCFPSAEACTGGQGQWQQFGAPVTVTIN